MPARLVNTEPGQPKIRIWAGNELRKLILPPKSVFCWIVGGLGEAAPSAGYGKFLIIRPHLPIFPSHAEGRTSLTAIWGTMRELCIEVSYLGREGEKHNPCLHRDLCGIGGSGFPIFSSIPGYKWSDNLMESLTHCAFAVLLTWRAN